MEEFRQRVRKAWNVFAQRDQFVNEWDYGPGYSIRPDRVRYIPGTERTIISSIYTRIALDVCAVNIQHVQLDKDGRFIDIIHSGLHECMNVSANIDQSGKAFLQDIVMSMLDEGSIAIVPIDTVTSLETSGAYQIRTLRTGKIVQWYPYAVRVSVYNDQTGSRQEIVLPKSAVAIIENPLYSIMNEPISTLKRLIHKLNLLDRCDEQIGSGKLDLIIQLPYMVKSDLRKKQAEQRRLEMESQLSASAHGIAYTDATEKITQLNRPAENNLLTQIGYLTKELYNQLGMSESVFDGTADEAAMINYYGRTIDPIVTTITEELRRKYLDSNSRAKYESIQHFRDAFALVPISKVSEMADKFTRNEIMSSNELRKVLGLKASPDPRADELLNKNMSAKNVDEPPNENIKMEVKNESV